MEVFVNSIAHSATELDVIQAVAAVLHAPPLSQNALRTNFHVNLFRYHTQNRHQVTAAKLTIPDLDLARRFLGSYGTFSMAKIFVHGRPMRFGVSKDNARPELLHKLRTTAFVDPRVERDKRKKLAELSHPIRIAGVEFGRLCGDDVFSPESEHSLPSGEISFDGERRMVVVKSSSSSQARTICMPFSSLDKIFALPTTTPSVLIFLAKPPLFEETGPERLFNPSDRDPFGFDDILASFLEDMSLEAGPPPHRRKAAFAALHAPTSPFTSSHIRILFPPSAELEQFRYRRNKIRLPKVVSSHIKIERRLLFAPSKLAKLNSIMSRLEISVAFQIQLMLSNGILDAEQLCGLGLESEVVALEQKLGAVGAEKVLALFASHLLHSSGEEPERDDYDWLEDDLESATNSRPFITRDPHRPIKPRTPTDLVAELRRAADHVRLTPSRRFNADQSSVCRHVVITPTSLDLEGPFPDQSNSVLRLYGRPECFIRISVRDEDYGKFRHDRETDVAKFLRERFLPFFVDGIQLAGRKFEFLGYSSSALRDHSTWFLTPFSHQGRLVNAVSIRRGLGDFSKVQYIPARWMARVAQAFTATQPSLTLRPSQVRRIRDVEARDPTTGLTSCFTDGVGTISPSLAEKVDSVLAGALSPYNRRRRVKPTCYQIRFGGAKGMLAVDSKLRGSRIGIRPSMEKFDAPDSLTLDIAHSFSRPLLAFLNRPLINILEDLGIRNQALIDLQRRAVLEVEKARSSCSGAATLLDRTSLGTSSHFLATLRLINRLVGLDFRGPALLVDSFAESCIDLAVTHALRDLKFRARIPLPDCWTLVGVADEDGFLREGEVYACIERPGCKTLYLEGEIAISRSPTIHPGDVRVVRAVGKLPAGVAPRIRGLSNCVVFSTKGTRSLPSCLGGGDLDGDLYVLITRPDLIPARSRIAEPGAYTGPQMKTLGRPCTIGDGALFFLDYILSDLMGVVATRHLLLADKHVDGTFSADCLRLAELHSDAVDFPKTGTPVNVRELPRADNSFKPDFLAAEYQANRVDKDFYPSPKVLGQLFRDIPLHLLDPTDHTPPADPRRYSLDSNRRLTSRLSQLPIDGLEGGAPGLPRSDLVEELATLIPPFTDKLHRICRLNTLSHRRDRHLSEEEAFVGTISATSKDKRRKQEVITRLQEQTSVLFEGLREDICGYGEDEEERVERAFAAWGAALEEDQTGFGVRTFGWITLGLLLGLVAEMNGEE